MFSCLAICPLFGQDSKEITVLPGQGIVLNSDTFTIGMTPTELFSDLDTNSIKTKIHHSIGMAEGIEIMTDSIEKKATSKDVYWETFFCDVSIVEHPITFKFEGDSKDDLTLDKIIVDFPCKAKTSDGLEIGANKSEIFKGLYSKEGSYTCSDNGFFYCYYNYGISFGVQQTKELPHPELFEKVVSLEIYRKTD